MTISIHGIPRAATYRQCVNATVVVVNGGLQVVWDTEVSEVCWEGCPGQDTLTVQQAAQQIPIVQQLEFGLHFVIVFSSVSCILTLRI